MAHLNSLKVRRKSHWSHEPAPVSVACLCAAVHAQGVGKCGSELRVNTMPGNNSATSTLASRGHTSWACSCLWTRAGPGVAACQGQGAPLPGFSPPLQPCRVQQLPQATPLALPALRGKRLSDSTRGPVMRLPGAQARMGQACTCPGRQQSVQLSSAVSHPNAKAGSTTTLQPSWPVQQMQERGSSIAPVHGHCPVASHRCSR